MSAFNWRATGRNAQRVLLVGKTGSGKTVLGAQLAAAASPVVYFDPKRMNDPQWATVLGTQEAVQRISSGGLQDGDRVIVQPEINRDWTRTDQLDRLAEAVFWRGNVALVVDDAMGVLGTTPPYFVDAIVTEGRARGIGFMAMVQRVHNIPRVLLTDAEHIICFELHGRDDVDRLVREADQSLAAAGDLARFSFFWYDREARQGARFRPIPLPAGVR